MVTTILFDLDGTLLPMDQDEFVREYFKRLAGKVAPLGYEPKKLVEVIWQGMETMVKNDGTVKNEEAFWKCFESHYGTKVYEDKAVFEEFYRVEFQEVANYCGKDSKAKEVIEKAKEMGFCVVLATNPIFPAIATESRIRWAGLKPEDFEWYTTYENSSHCKPNPEYYKDILQKINCRAEECLMVGNDVAEDMVAETLGMKVFLLKDCIINKEEKDISSYPQGGFEELLDYLQEVR